MKKLIQKFILSSITTMTLFGFASNVFAVPLGVTFTPDPLFNKSNFLPSDETNGQVTVINNSGASQTILTEAINVLDNDNFSSFLHLKIVGSNGTLYDDSLADFFAIAGEVSLGAIFNGESKIFTYVISFIDSSNNSYQGKTLGFDVCVGFSGGTKHCGDTAIGGENDTGRGSGGRGGSLSGGGSGPMILAILNEQTVDMSGEIPSTDTVTITWNTNILSTSQVVYGLLSGGPYTLDLTAVNFGYPIATVEDAIKVTNHSVLLTRLIPGETYLYRVVSRASPPTISLEHRFIVPLAVSSVSLLAQVPANNFTESNSSASTFNTSGSEITSGGVDMSNPLLLSSGVSSGKNLSLAEETNTNLLAAVLFGFNANVWRLLLALFLLLIIYFVYRRVRH